MKKARHFIILPHGERSRLAKDFKTTYRTVYSALNFITNSPKARILREAALKRGGYEYPTSNAN